jgi:predicted CoA-binding protein
MELLGQYGHQALPVHPREVEVLGKKVIHQLKDLAGQKIDTVTVYVNAAISDKYETDFLLLKPTRVIFNPGAENPRLARILAKAGIKIENACTLVLLRTNQFSANP